MKLFHFYRSEDHSGVSGTGPVVEGVQFSNGWCALRWMSRNSSVCFYQSLEDVKNIHGHGGKTEIIVHDFEPPSRRKTGPSNARFELFLRIIEELSNVMTQAEDPETPAPEIQASMGMIRELLEEFEKKLVRHRKQAA